MIEIKLILNKKNEPAKISENGKIQSWPGMTLEEIEDYTFVGVSKYFNGNYAFTKNEMIKENITSGIYYPVVCDSLGNFAILREKILEIEYVPIN